METPPGCMEDAQRGFSRTAVEAQKRRLLRLLERKSAGPVGQKKRTPASGDAAGVKIKNILSSLGYENSRNDAAEKNNHRPQGFFRGLPPGLSFPASLNSAFTALMKFSEGCALSLPVRRCICARRSARRSHSAAKAAVNSVVV